MGGNSNKLELPKVDLTGLGMAEPGTKAWSSVQEKVASALMNYGCFQAIYNDIEAELQNGLIEQALLDVFKEEAKFSYAPSLPCSGWLLQLTGFAFKSLQLNDPESLADVQDNTMCNYAKHMQGLLQTIHRMIILSLDLDDHYHSHIKSVEYSMRLSEYFDDVQNNKTKIGMPSHVDSNYVSIILQQKEGLEIESPNHGWIRITPLPNSFTVLIGEAFMAWTNRRFRARNHRVKLDGSSKRYSIIFSSIPSRSDDMIQTMDELVDNKHPLVYKPFKYYDYLKFRFSNGEKEDTLKSYCGVEQAEAAA
ncbi:hypothetical protein IEQ34_012756 [Dendrobium chrysotoxum]|uniref:Fe2OG dioxygenase domain-containing protein n=1 Tax=Dendrobium chrysotoxum TaxID=161865 RepID=A0AAV7GLL4_DENCH|nr:hypothetical protein IEQ34_012756 [Dendrobium chrysotoxum]